MTEYQLLKQLCSFNIYTKKKKASGPNYRFKYSNTVCIGDVYMVTEIFAHIVLTIYYYCIT